jgi:hypothetical protein
VPRSYKNEGIDQIYQLLFCDDADLYRSLHTSPEVYPWNVLFAANPETDRLAKVLHDPQLETRPRLLAARLLAENGVVEPQPRLMGVILEVGMDDGLDVLAAYEDGSARYINYTGNIVVWDTKTAESVKLVDRLFETGNLVVDQIGPWEETRRPAPPAGIIRLNFLVSDGLYFGEGPFSGLQQDELGGPVIAAGIALMQFLTKQVNA